MNRRTALVATLVLLGAIVPVLGVGAEGLEFTFTGPRFNFLILGGLPLPTGADIGLRRTLAEDGLGPLALWLRLGAAYEDKRLVRDPVTGDPVAAPVETTDPARFHAPNAQWDLGLAQAFDPGFGRGGAEAFLLYRGRWDFYDNQLAETAFPDTRGLFGTALIAGLAYDGVERDGRRVLSGVEVELSYEWGPAFLASGADPVDYGRANLKAEGYLPLFSRGKGELNLASAYLACHGSLDWATGEQVPIFVMQSFGGVEDRTSLGGSVRGYPSKTWDAGFKAVANVELRLLGPALLGLPWFMPLVYGFVDAGAYAGLPGASAAWADASGTIASAGGGFALDILDFAYVGFSAGMLFPGDDALFPVYLPGGERTFFSVEFLLHF